MYSLPYLLLFVGFAASKDYCYLKFQNAASFDDWVQSTYLNDEKRGKWSISSSKAWDDGTLGLKTDTDARFYAITKKLSEPFSNRDKTLVVQYTVKFENTVSCGGAYLKLLKSDIDQSKFNGDTPYLFMFGPDICGYSTKKVHAIFNYNGTNHLMKKDVPCKDDQKSHLYTFILTPDNKYKMLIDNAEVSTGDLEEHWDMLPPKKINDPASQKPADWVDEKEIDDPDDVKPKDWDKPKTIPDPDAKKPDDWNDELDGEWEPAQIDNPEYRGEWHPQKITNPAYKGPWVAPQIDNPDYKPDPELYVMDDIGYVGFELWQVTSGSIFNDILITDDPEFAKSEGDKILASRKKMEDEFERRENERLEKEAAAAAAEKDKEKAEQTDIDEEEEEEKKEDKEKEGEHEEL